MKKIVNAILVAIMVAALVFGFASCGNNASGNGNTNPNEKPDNGENPDDNDKPDDKPDDKTELSVTSDDGKYSYEIKGNIFTLKYTGTDKPDIGIAFFRQYPENPGWPWKGFYNYKPTYSGELSVNMFDCCALTLWGETAKRPETQDMLIEIKANNQKVLFNNTSFINVKLISDEVFLASKDYSKKTFVSKNMTFTSESAKSAVAKMKTGTNLANHFDSFLIDANGEIDSFKSINNKDLPPAIWETALEEDEITRDDIKKIKEIGFSVVRIPVTWWCHLDNDGNILPGWMNRIQEVVDWCMEENLYVILNTHHDSGYVKYPWLVASQESYEQYNGRYKKIWEQIATRFKGYSEKLIFANANEVQGKTGDTNWAAIRGWMEKWNQLFVDTVRSTGGNNVSRNLVVSDLGTDWNVANDLKLPNDSAKDHLILEIHCYEPGDFCNGDNDALGASEQEWKTEAYFDAESFLNPAWKYSMKNNIPVIVGEWGVQPAKGKNVNDAERAKYARMFVPESMKRGFGTIIWWPQIGFTYAESPLYLQAIKDCVNDTSITFGDYKTIKFKDFEGGNMDKTYDYDDKGNQLKTYSVYRALINITSYFSEELPKEGDIVKFDCIIGVNNNVTLRIGLVDHSENAGWWKELAIPKENFTLIESNGDNATMYMNYFREVYEITASPVEEVWMYIDYQKTELDENSIVALKSDD